MINKDNETFKIKNQVFTDLYKNNVLLKNKYDEVLNLFELYKKTMYDSSCNMNVVNDSLKEFLKIIDCDRLYNDIKENEMFVHGSKNVFENICIDNIDLSYIVLGRESKNKIEYYLNLLHSIGHAYANRVLQMHQFGYYDSLITREIIPILFELMFIDYLKSNHILDNNKIYGIMRNQQLKGIYNVHCANIICLAILNSNIIKNIDAKKYQELTSGLNSNINEYTHHLAIGFIIANNLVNEYKKNGKDFIKDLPYIVMDMSKLNIQNLMDKYYSIDAIKNNVVNQDYFIKREKCIKKEK